MMIPKVINETDKKIFEDGSYIKQYVVHAPEWDVVIQLVDGLEHTHQRVAHFIISESTRCGYLETLVFPADEDGKVIEMLEIMGGREYTADEILTSFGKMMLEAGYDPV